MAFNTGSGGSIATSTDVTLSNVANNEVLAYSTTNAKWQNAAVSAGSGSAGVSQGAIATVYASGVPAAIRPSATDASKYVWVCTGTNDEAVINAAITAVAAQGQGKVQLIGSLFNLSASIRIRTGIWLSGEGLGTELKAASDFNAGMVTLYDNSAHATKFTDVTINGNGRAVHGVHYIANGGQIFNSPISTNPDPSHIIRDLYIQACGTGSFAGHGMLMEGPNLRAGKYSDIRILGCSGCGVWVNNAPDSHYTNIEVGSSGKNGPAYSASTSAPVGHGFFVLGSNNMFTACKGWYSRGAGFYNIAVRNGYTNCQAQDNYSNGFHIQYGKSSFVGCHADSNGQMSGAGGLGRAGFYLATELVTISACESYERGSQSWEQQWGFQFTGGSTRSRVLGCITYANGATTGGGSVTGTPGTGTTIDIQADSSGN